MPAMHGQLLSHLLRAVPFLGRFPYRLRSIGEHLGDIAAVFQAD